MSLAYDSGPQKKSEKSVAESGHVTAADWEKILDAELQMASRISTHHLCILAMHHHDRSLLE